MFFKIFLLFFFIFLWPEVFSEEIENHLYGAEVNKLMTLLIHSLYSTKEIFLRELISNSADALNKLKFLSLTNQSLIQDDSDLKIKILVNESQSLLIISDNGIGMTKTELIENLGTIARSGSANFSESLLNRTNETNLIGQFGVGFYSSFLVSDKVTVETKHHEDDYYIWESDSKSYSIRKTDGTNFFSKRGTTIILHANNKSKEFLDVEKLEKLIHTYNRFVPFPIYLYKSTVKETIVPDEEKMEEWEKKRNENKSSTQKDGDINEEENTIDENPPTKTLKETVFDYHLMNNYTSIWRREPKTITDEEYNDFYKSNFQQTEEPFGHIHYTADGQYTFTALIYIPKTNPTSMNQDLSHSDLKLYAKRVFITKEFGHSFFPKYLSFLKGVIDSDDFELNVSREHLQKSKLFKIIQKSIIGKVLSYLKQLKKKSIEEYLKFYKQYAFHLKVGIIQDSENKDTIGSLLLFKSSKTDLKDKKSWTSLDEYVSNKKDKDQPIYFVVCQTLDECKNSPLSEKLVKLDYEVLYFTEMVDESIASYLSKYKLQNIAKEEQIHAADISTRLQSSPFAVLSREWAYSGTMQKAIKAQKKISGIQKVYFDQKVKLEINPYHPLIQKLYSKVQNFDIKNKSSEELSEMIPEVADVVYMLFEVSRIRSGYDIQDSLKLSKTIERVGRRLYNVSLDEPIEEEPIFQDEPIQDEENSKSVSSNAEEQMNNEKDEL